jgi:hypothetical protein
MSLEYLVVLGKLIGPTLAKRVAEALSAKESKKTKQERNQLAKDLGTVIRAEILRGKSLGDVDVVKMVRIYRELISDGAVDDEHSITDSMIRKLDLEEALKQNAEYQRMPKPDSGWKPKGGSSGLMYYINRVPKQAAAKKAPAKKAVAKKSAAKKPAAKKPAAKKTARKPVAKRAAAR